MAIRKKVLTGIFLLTVLAFHFFNNYFWLKNDNCPQGVDTIWHLIEAAKFQMTYKGILHGSHGVLKQMILVYDLFVTWPLSSLWPPLTYLLNALLSPGKVLLFNTRFYLNFLFLFLLVISTFFLGKRFFGSKTGLLSAFLVSFFPATYAFSRQFEIDFPLAGFTALCLALLAHTEQYSNRFYTVLFGIFLALATLVKLQVLLFLAGPIFVCLFLLFKKRSDIKSRSFVNFWIGVSLFAVIACPYWHTKTELLFSDFNGNVLGLYPGFASVKAPVLGEKEIAVASVEWLIYYARHLLNLMSLPLFVVFLWALWRLILSKEKTKSFLLVGVFLPYLLFTLISAKWARYILPLLPLAAVVSAWALMNIPSCVARRTLVSVIVCFSLVLFLCTSWCNSCGFYQALSLEPVEPPSPSLPDADGCQGWLQEGDIFQKLEDKLITHDLVEVKFVEGVHDCVSQLYLRFQEEIFLGKLKIERVDLSHVDDADYVFFANGKLTPDDAVLKEYKIVFQSPEGAYFLEKR